MLHTPIFIVDRYLCEFDRRQRCRNTDLFMLAPMSLSSAKPAIKVHILFFEWRGLTGKICRVIASREAGNSQLSKRIDSGMLMGDSVDKIRARRAVIAE